MREGQEEGEFISVKIHTNENGSDMLMKPLPIDRRQDYSTFPLGVQVDYCQKHVAPMGEVDGPGTWEKSTVKDKVDKPGPMS